MSEREPWLPTRYTPALRDELTTDGDRLIAAVEQLWTLPDGSRLVLDDWQKWLIRRILERYPADWPVEKLRGKLRYRQVVVSMGRQNGKSVLGAILGFYGLAMHDPGPEVIGLARNREQANIVYARVLHAIKSHPELTRRFRATGTRGISHRNGSGNYTVKPAKGEALQGIPVSVCIFDELHIARTDMWGAVVNGQRTRRNGLLVGITTAGDDESELLKSLYATGEQAVAGGAERFGFFLWEAPAGSTIDTPGAIEAANPTIAEHPEGSSHSPDVETVRSDVRLLPVVDQERYTLNRWVSSSSAWLELSAWRACAGTGPAGDAGGLFYVFERTPGWEHAAITATAKEDGTVRTTLVASIVRPSLDQLEEIALRLRARGPATFAMDSRRLGALAERLKAAGHDVRELRQGDAFQAGPAAYSLIVAGKVSHTDDPVVFAQISKARRLNVGENWRLARPEKGGEIDAALATVYGIYLADSYRDPGIQIF